jgi:enolase
MADLPDRVDHLCCSSVAQVQPNDGKDKKTGGEMLEMYKSFCTQFPVVTIEDPFEQDDWEPLIAFTAENVCQARSPLIVHQVLCSNRN